MGALEEELTQAGLLVHRHGTGKLKVTLVREIPFRFDSAEIPTKSHATLDALAAVLMRHMDSAAVRVIGHTDSSGPHQYNFVLSQRRAEAVANYLIRQGLDVTRIRSEGRGETEPLVNVEGEFISGKWRSRRIEIVIDPAG